MASIFREQNLERVSNPDTLDDYIRIANPGVWMVLIAIILLIVGAFVWGLFGTVNVDSQGVLAISRGSTVLWLDENAAGQVAPGSTFWVDDQKGMVTSAAGAPEPVEELQAEVGDSGNVELGLQGQWVCPLSASINLPAGTYPARVTVESYSPLQLIFGAGQTGSSSEG